MSTFSLTRFFRPSASPRQKLIRLQLEELESRLSPAVFNPLPSIMDGASLSLRDAVLQADGNSDASNTINLAAGAYTLNDAAAGNLLIQDAAAGVASKTFTLVGQGTASTIITGGSGWHDRIFQIVSAAGATVTVTLQNVTITGGNAQNSGLVGGNAALGGGLLIDGGQVSLTNVSVSGNAAHGAAGVNGANGAAGQAGAAGTGAPTPTAAASIWRPAR